MTGLPTGTVTLLMSDVEGSTRLWERSSSEMSSSMSDLDALVDELVAKFDGARPAEQGEGDSFVAGFARASDALACAIEIQRQLASGSLRVRMSLHTGEIEIRDGNRYDGPTIIRAARIRDLGHGGQVLLSSTTRDVVRDVLPEGADLIDLGSHRLKGLDRAEHVHQLTHADLQERFPALRSHEPVKGNLPVRLTSFVGRTTELADVQRLVQDNRLVTLTGAGGCGKTRLAVEALEPLADEFDDGIWFCDLSPLNDPTVIPQALRSTLGLREDPLRADIDVLCEYLAEHRAVIVIDNCEHMIDASATLADTLLRRCTGLHVLATTREPLGVEGEVAWRVPSLADSEAVDLFGSRAGQVRPNFSVNDQSAAIVAEICTRLDGIPLAIELAAARVRSLSVQQIADGLNDRFRLLGRGARTMLARQQTLLASVGWSYDLLTEEQRAVLRRAAVFSGGFTLEAAEFVLSGDDVAVGDVLDVVSQLVDRSLLVADEVGTKTRYRMLETIRQFARDRLVDSGESSVSSGKHLDCFAAWVRSELVRVGTGERTMPRFGMAILAEFANIRAASEWALADGRFETGLDLVANTRLMWIGGLTATGVRETRGWIEDFLEAGVGISDETRLSGLIALVWAASTLGDMRAAVAAGEEAAPLARVCRNDWTLAETLTIHGISMTLSGFLEEGLVLLDEAAAVARRSSPNPWLRVILFQSSQLRGWAGKEALAMARESVEIGRAIAEGGEGTGSSALGFCLLLHGEVDEATSELESARSETIATGDRYWEAAISGMLGYAAWLRGDRQETRRLFDDALAMADAIGMDVVTSMVGMWAAEAATAEARFEDADARFVSLERVMAEFGPGPTPVAIAGYVRALRAVAHVARGEFDRARDALDAAASDPFFMPSTEALRRSVFARVARALGELSSCEAHLYEALSSIAELEMFVYAPNELEVAGAVRADVGAYPDAVRLFGAASAARGRMGTARPPDPIWDAEAELAAIRERLSGDDFQKAWADGEALSLEEALAFALRGRGPRERPQAGWDAITPTEMKVISLVAEGLSNPQIAERLFISPRTVSTHLSHVFTKLGVSSRAELASAATKRGVT